MADRPSIFRPDSNPTPISEIKPPAKSKMERQAEKMHARLVATYRKPKR